MGQSITPNAVLRFLKAYLGTEFSWGVNDCATFITDYMLTFTGKDYRYLASFTWTTKREAMKFVATGGKSFYDLIRQVDAVKVASFRQAKTGDIVVLDQGGWDTSGILINGKVAWFVENCGLKIENISKSKIKLILRVY